MPSELLHLLAEASAFDPVLPKRSLKEFHVPFDQLLGGAAVERRLQRAATAAERVALVGASGSGKSSLVEYTLMQGELDGVAPLRLPVSIEPAQTITDVGRFCQHVIRTLGRAAEEAALVHPEDRERLQRETSDRAATPERGRTVRREGGIALPWLSGGLAREVSTVLPAEGQQRSAVEMLTALEEFVALLRDEGLIPIFVLDDTDRWLRVVGVGDRTPLVGPFFGPVLRTLAELEIGLVVAVHPTYLEMPEYRAAAEGFLNCRINLPALRESAHLRRILDRRIAVFAPEASAGHVFDAEAVDALFAIYGSGTNLLRSALTAAHVALNDATDGGFDRITVDLTEQAAAQLS